MKCILAGTDGSEAASSAVAWAADLARAVGGDLLVASVFAPGLSGVEPREPGEQRAQVADLLETEWCAPVRSALSDFRTLVLEGDPKAALLDAAVREGADVLVLGSVGTGWFPALHLGHVAHAIAEDTPVPLVLVRGEADSLGAGPIVVGIDGSRGSETAVRWTTDLALTLDREVVAVHAHLRHDLAEQRAELEESCAQWAAPLLQAGVRARVLVLEGWPATVLTEVEAIEHAGLVVIGTRGAGAYRDLHLSSVALQVIHQARIPVAVVPCTD